MVDEQTSFALLDTRGRGARPRMDAPYIHLIRRRDAVRARLHPGAVRSPSAQRCDFLTTQMTGDGDISGRGLDTLGGCCRAAKMEGVFTRLKGD